MVRAFKLGMAPIVVALMIATGWILSSAHSNPGEDWRLWLLTVATTLLSRRLIQKVNPSDAPDINARDARLIGQRAQVVQAFVDGRGRVFVSGAEWVAEIEGATPAEGDSVIVEGMDGPKLKVRAA